MELILYNSKAEKKRLDKDEFLSAIVTLHGTLREACNVTTPSIMINLSNNTTKVKDDNDSYYIVDSNTHLVVYNIIEKLIGCNYAYIKDFKRFYFITNIISINKGLWRLDMRSDGLSSFKNNILNLNAFVTRNEFTYDTLIRDDLVTYEYDKDVNEFVPDKGTYVNTTFSTESHTRNFMLSCISFGTLPSAWEITSPDGKLPTIQPLYYTEQFGTTCYILQSYEAEYVTYRALKNASTVGSYIKSLIAYPYELTPHTTNPEMYPLLFIGETQIKNLLNEDVSVPLSKYKLSEYLIIGDFTIPSTNSFLDVEPYTYYELYIPYCGWVTLDSNKILDKRILVFYTVSYDDGSANAYVYNTTDGMLLWTGTCQLGVKIGISTTNNEELSASRKANNLNLTLGLVSSALSVGVGVASGNPVAVTGGVLSGAKSVASYVNNNSMMFDKAQATYSTGASGMYNSQDVVIRITKMKPKNYDNDYASLHGRPLNKYIKLSDLTGYTVVGNVHLEGFDTATDTELNEIDTLLKEGIII